MARDAAEALGRAVASGSTGRSGEVILDWMHGSEGKEGSRGKDQGESWMEESCRGEEEKEKDGGVSQTVTNQRP